MITVDTRRAPARAFRRRRRGQRRSQWPEPKPLPSGLPDVPPFAADLLPVAFRAWVMDVAERMQCPPDFPAVAVMIAAGSLIGRQIAIRPKRHDDWTVVPNLWGASIGRPSLMKSPALHEALMPLVAMEAAAAEQHREAVADWEAGQVVAKEAAKVNATEIRKLLKQAIPRPPRRSPGRTCNPQMSRRAGATSSTTPPSRSWASSSPPTPTAC